MDKPAILIAVDDEGTRASIAELLRGHGYDVFEAARKSEVMDCVHERGPDLVIVGSSRDETWDALEVAREIRKTDRMLPIILVSGYSTEDLAIAAVKAGITDYFKLPFSFDELTASVSRCLADFALGLRSAALEMSNSDVSAAPRMIGESRQV